MIGINGKSWDEVKSSDIKSILERISGEDSIFDESIFFEWKADKESSSKLAKEICAFSNTFGGYVFLGMSSGKRWILPPMQTAPTPCIRRSA